MVLKLARPGCPEGGSTASPCCPKILRIRAAAASSRTSAPCGFVTASRRPARFHHAGVSTHRQGGTRNTVAPARATGARHGHGRLRSGMRSGMRVAGVLTCPAVILHMETACAAPALAQQDERTILDNHLHLQERALASKGTSAPYLGAAAHLLTVRAYASKRACMRAVGRPGWGSGPRRAWPARRLSATLCKGAASPQAALRWSGAKDARSAPQHALLLPS